jgi:membrane-associated protein
MSDYIVHLVEFVRQHEIWFLGSLLVLQNNGVPLASSLVVMASGAMAYTGEFSLPILGFYVWLFSLLGDVSSYWLWRGIDKHVVHRSRRVNQAVGKWLEKAEGYYDRYGRLTVFTTRFPFSALGTVVNVFAGATGYNFILFFITVAVGQLIWSIFYLGLGYLFSDSWEQLALVISQSGWLMTIVGALVFAAYLARKMCLKRSNNKNHESNS